MHDVRSFIDSGEIIEQYPDDFPFASCLILGNSGEKVLHIVASAESENIYVITAYRPSPDKWETDWKTRRRTDEMHEMRKSGI